MSVCVRACMRVCVCVCVRSLAHACVRENKIERQPRGRIRKKKGGKKRERPKRENI